MADVLQFLYRLRILFAYRNFQVRPEKISLWTLDKYVTQIKPAHDTVTEGRQPRSSSHHSHLVTSGIPQHDKTRAAVC